MRHIRRFALVPAAVALMSGCNNLEDTGESAFNPAQDVNPGFSTFVIKDPENGAPNLPYTRFHDFYRGVEPNQSDSGQDYQAALALAEELRNHIDVLAGATREAGTNRYKSVRNPLDLMDQVIRSDQILNFREGREYIVELIEKNTPGAYNSRAAGATISFTSQRAILEGMARADQVWVYPTLAWYYQPEGEGDQSDTGQKVRRTIQYVARSAPEGETATPPQLLGVVSGSQYDALSFSAIGYNAPEFVLADFNTRNYGSLEMRQDYVQDKYDEIYLRNVDGNLSDENRITVEGEEADCLKVRLNYQTNTLEVFASSGIPRTEPAPTEKDPDKTQPTTDPEYCTNKEAADVTYSVNGVPERA